MIKLINFDHLNSIIKETKNYVQGRKLYIDFKKNENKYVMYYYIDIL